MSQGYTLGGIGVVNPKVAKKIDNKINIVFAELDFGKLQELTELTYKFAITNKYPGTELDFNFEIPNKMLYADIEKIATSMTTDLQYKVSLTNIFKPEGSEYINYTLHYDVCALDHTITGEEIETFHKLVISTFKDSGINLKS